MNKHYFSNLSILQYIGLSLMLTCFSLNIQAQHGKIKKGDDPFLKLNRFFRKSYANTRKVMIEKHAPAIAFVNGGLLFVRKGVEPRWVNITPDLYTDLKTISHIPLAVYVILAIEKEGRLSTAKLTELKNLLLLVNEARKAIKSKSFTSDDQRKAQYLQSDLALDLINKCLRTNNFLHQDLKVFLEKSRPLIQRNVLESITAQLEVAHKHTQEFYSELSDEEKKKLIVVVSGPKAARDQHAITQYFARVLNVKGEGAKILYAESVFSRKGVMNIMGTFLLDTEVGIAFFGDRWRMHRDLLSDAARYYISTMSFKAFE
ncbi:MAG TPA: hypothetical protein DCS93_27270 [Microscillaceae bacterium]|nr:hypothetical protein [Microscillaceae bacterium]